MSSDTNPAWIDTDSKLKDAVHEIIRFRQIGVDTESNSLFAYQEQICLIQISTPRKNYLIDTLALTNISQLKTVFENPRIQKIFHAVEYDLICLKRDFGFQPVNLFDTMLAARILSLPEVGLAALLKSRFGVIVDKHFQRANWGERPLLEALKQYACTDSQFLISLSNELLRELKHRKLLELAKEDFFRLETIKIPLQRHKDEIHGTNGKGRLSPRQSTVLQALCEYRDQEAQRRDVPHFKVFGDDVLVSLARKSPRKMEELKDISGLNSRQIRIHGCNLLKAVAKGAVAQPPISRPRDHIDRAFVLRIDQLKQWRKKTADEMYMDSDVILPKETLESIARHNPGTIHDLGKVMSGQKWRVRQFGVSILSILSSLEAE